MLFRRKNGKIIEILRKNYITDTEYYKAILLIK